MGSAEKVNSNNDLLTDILCRLPVKPLTQFKTVSKQWLYLISDTWFSRLQAACHKPIASALLLCSSENDQKLDFVAFHDKFQLGVGHLQFFSGKGATILHSCNGFFCYSKLEESNDRPILEYYVCNATTRKSVKIPLMALVYFSRRHRGKYRSVHKLYKANVEDLEPENELTIQLLGVYVTFDPQISPHYRVVCVWEWDSFPWNYQIKIAIYRSETRSWGETLGPFKVPYGVSFNPGVFWNDRLHWICKSHMVIFDVNRENHTVISLPLTSEASEPIYFGESKGHLHIVINDDSTDTQLNVFEMERDYSLWVLKFCLHIESILVLIPDTEMKYKPPAFSVIYLDKGANEDESCLLLGFDGKLISYSLESKTLKKLRDLKLFSFQNQVGWAPFHYFKCFPFHETILEV